MTNKYTWVVIVYSQSEKVDSWVFEHPEDGARDKGKAWVEKNWGDGTDWSLHRVSSKNNAQKKAL